MSGVYTTITIEREPEEGQFLEIEVECRFEYHAACRGARDSCGGVLGAGPQLEPDEPAMLEFYEAKADGKTIDLTDAELRQAENQAWEEIQDAMSDY